MPAREVWELLMAGAGGAVLAELGSTFRDGRASRRARTSADDLARLDAHDRVVRLEGDVAQMRRELVAVVDSLQTQAAAAGRLEHLGQVLADTHELLVAVIAATDPHREL